MLPRHSLHILLFYALLTSANSPIQLGFIPLAVKTPYLHAWITNSRETSPAQQISPSFFTTDRPLGWSGIIRVDDQAFQWMGIFPINNVTTVLSEITPTKSIFRLQAGLMQFNVTFFTPIEPADYIRQSMPFSYMFLDGFAATDSQTHNIQVYTDITAEWVTRDDTQVVVWKTTETDTVVYHNVTRRDTPSLTANTNDFAEDSVVYYAMVKRPGLTWKAGPSVDCRTEFVANGTLSNARDVGLLRASQGWPIFAFSTDLGTVSPGSQLDPVVVALGLVRDPLVTYVTESSTQNRSGYYWSAYTSIDQVVNAFINDFSDARNRNTDLDSKILSAASVVSNEYAGILSLATRQIFAAMDITIPSAQPGQFNNSDVKIFMKDMGVSLRTNPVEVIYGAFPALLYFNPSLAKDLLLPLLEFQSSSLYGNPYAAPDLGTIYPTIPGNAGNTHALAVENCGNMLVMAYAHAAKSGDGSLFSRYYTTLQGWANFLMDNSLHPSDFVTADGLNNPNMSNLAIKGILGVYSMAKINEAVKVSDNTYTDRTKQLIADWKKFAVTSDHIDSVYGQSISWGLMYNLFPAIWLNTDLIENDTLALQAGYYEKQFNNIPGSKFGLSLDISRPGVASPHWTLMTAATIPDNLITVRNQLIKSIYLQSFRPGVIFPLPVTYNPSTSIHISGSGSAIQGASFGVLALSLPNVNIKADSVNLSSNGNARVGEKSNIGGIIGGVVGGLAFLLILLSGGYFLRRKRRQKQGVDTIQGDYVELEASRWPPSDRDEISQPQQFGPNRNVRMLNSSSAGASAVSCKRREAYHQRANRNNAHDPTSNPAAPLLPNQNPTSVPGTEELRVEVSQLRREINSIRRMAEPPPRYN